MLTRSKTAALSQPQCFQAAIEPRSVKDALQHPEWKKAMDAEYAILLPFAALRGSSLILEYLYSSGILFVS
ncbi:hypothetical protein PIB30_055673 [Stylosanthes scabra]|uniref:Uncharacterized protein n=1 Tax=Stylosanthes scabra TaxID=79078 RepID=A0ABU6ZHS4_9FABA|nr:hypothetical protein [Stylosanthes scabra]